MKKKILLVMLMIALLVCLFAISASAETTSKYIGFKVMLSGEENYIDAYTTNADSGNPKLNFASDFYYDNDLTQVITKDDIVKIDLSEAYAKNGSNTIIKSVGVSSTAYANVTEVKWFNREGSVSAIPQNCFLNWTSLNKFDFGCATLIDVSPFKNTGFVDLVIPATVTQIKNSAFEACLSLKTLTIEGSLSSGVGTGMFSGCTALETATMNEITTLGTRMFKNCSNLTTVIAPKATVIKEEAIGSTCTSITTIDLNFSNITSIEQYAFEKLTVIPENLDLSNVTSIGTRAFEECTGIKTVNAPKVVTISNKAFNGCSNLTSVNAPAVTKINDQAFYNCEKLVDFTTTSVLTYIGQETFRGCTSLEGPFDYSALTDLKAHAFYGCSSLILGDVNLSSLTSGGSSFIGCTGLTSISYPEGITSIGGLKNCVNLVKISVPSTVESFSGNTFDGCSSLKTVEFRYNYEKYPEHGSAFTTVSNGSVFKNCTSLETLIFPNSLTHVDNAAFSGCTNLKTLVLGASFAETNQTPSIPTSVTSLVLTPNYNMNGQLMGSSSKFTFPTSFVVYYTGTQEQAQALQALNTNVYEICKSTLVSYEEFISDSFERDGSVHYFVYNYNICKAFYNDIHPEKVEDNNPCYLTECSRCTYEDRYVGNDNTHNMNTTYAYPNGYFVNGQIVEACKNEGCIYHGAENARLDTETLKPLFAELRYSAKEDSQVSFGLYVEYKIMQEAIALYKSFGKTVSYGVVAIMADKVSGRGPLNGNGTVADGVTNVVAAPVTSEALSTVKLIISGPRALWTGNADRSIYIAGYATDGESLEYLGVSSGAEVERSDIQSIKPLLIMDKYTEYTPMV